MKGVVLAGGYGTRLRPLTEVTNKHLLPVYNKPMIFYPIETLVEAGINDILIVTGGENVGDFIKLLGDGKRWNVNLTYRYQEGAGGIAAALFLAKEFTNKEKFICILGDNIMEKSIKKEIEEFKKSKFGARVLLQEVHEPQRFGIAEVKDNKVVRCYEKPKEPITNLAILGIYMLDEKVFDMTPKLKPSTRGELEITDILNNYIRGDDLTFSILKGFWVDAGTIESLFLCNNFMAEKNNWEQKIRK